MIKQEGIFYVTFVADLFLLQIFYFSDAHV